MKQLRLDLATLRASCPPGIGLSRLTTGALLDAVSGRQISRRGFLGLSGAALGASAVPWVTRAASSGPVELVGGSKRVAFLLGGRERWVIDTNLFSGAPELRVHQGKRRIRLALQGARFPGTDLLADFVSEIRPALLGSEMSLRFRLGALQTQVPFERWLMGEIPARVRVSSLKDLCSLINGPVLSLRSASHAEFFPNWVLRFEGPTVATLSGFGADRLHSDSLSVALLTPDDTSIFRKPEKRRTLFTLERGDHRWQGEQAFQAPDGTKIESVGSVFDRAALEVGEVQQGLLTESLDGSPHLSFLPGEHLLGSDGKAFQLPLCKARLAAAWDAKGEQKALVAELPEEPVWLHADGCALELGNAVGDAPFELVSLNGKVKRLKCTPALIRSALPMPDAIVEPARAPVGSRVSLVSGTVRAVPNLEVTYISLDPLSQGGVISLSEQVHSVLRPQDLLSLTFQFFNLTLKPGSPNGQLVRTNPSAPAYISVGFPPQNIAEQAFFETAPEFKSTVGNEQGKPPVQGRIAGSSRLVFSVPGGINHIPYTLSALLDWSKFDLSVAPVALPAPMLRPIRLVTRVPAALRNVAAPPLAAPPAITPPTTPEFLANHPTIVDHLLKQNPQLASSSPGLAQGLTQLKQQAAKPTSQTPQAAIQWAQAAFRSIANLGALLTQSLTIQPPDATTTAIEAPYRLYISPSSYGAWAHSISPVSAVNGWTELWHTRLGVREANGQASTPAEKACACSEDSSSSPQRIVRAIWSPDYSPRPGRHYDGTNDPDSQPFRASLDHLDHYNIVRLTSDFNNNLNVQPVQVNHLMLSSLGAWMDVQGAWPSTPAARELVLGVTAWTHRATMGRDNYVRVVYPGFLFPFGHAASLIKVTERKFERGPDGNVGAFLRQRMYLVVREHEKSYPVPGQPNDGREFPFNKVEITTQSTPALDDPTIGPGKISGQAAFWPYVASQPFQFHVIAEDLEGQQSEFTLPLIFVDQSTGFGGPQSLLGNNVIPNYNKESLRSTASVAGTKVAYAPSNKPGDTSLTTDGLTFASKSLHGSSQTLQLLDQAAFYPTVAQADVRIPAIAQLTGADTPTTIRLDDTYLASGLPNPSGNAGQVFAVIIQQNPSKPLQINFAGAADKSGGVATPSMTIVGLSRVLGIVGGNPASMSARGDMPGSSVFGGGLDPTPPPAEPLQTIKSGHLDPKEMFGSMLEQAKLLGGIYLMDVIKAVTDRTINFGEERSAPKITTRTIFPQDNSLAPPEAIETTVDWSPELQDVPTVGFIANKYNEKNTKATMEIVASLRTDLTGSPKPTYSIDGKLNNFQIKFVPAVEDVILIGFDEFHFTSGTGKKLDVTPNISGVDFLGPLSFVNQLKDILNQNKDKLNDPPSLDVTPTHVKVGYSLDLPDVSIGVMSLKNLSLGASLLLPFTDTEGPATVSFAFCSKDRPFIMSYCGFAGGGYFAIAVSLAGVQTIDISLEFGGNLSVNLGVASGGVSIMAGINFTLGQIQGCHGSGRGCALTAYIRLNGYLSILGLISLSLEFYLSLTYKSCGPGDILYGQATLTVEVDVLMFSKSVDITVEKEITSSGGISTGSLIPDNLPTMALGGGAEPRPPLSHPGPPLLTDLMSVSDWRTYMFAYARPKGER